MVYHLKRVSVWSVVKIAFIVSGMIGLFVGGLYGFFLFLLGGFANLIGGDRFLSNLGALSGIAGILLAVFLAMLFGVIGAVFAAIATWLYNLIANMVGGIELTLEPQESREASPQPAAVEVQTPEQASEPSPVADAPSSPEPQ